MKNPYEWTPRRFSTFGHWNFLKRHMSLPMSKVDAHLGQVGKAEEPWPPASWRKSVPLTIGYPLVMTNSLLWKDPPIFHGKTHYFDWAIFNSKPLNYQRVAQFSCWNTTLCRVLWHTLVTASLPLEPTFLGNLERIKHPTFPGFPEKTTGGIGPKMSPFSPWDRPESRSPAVQGCQSARWRRPWRTSVAPGGFDLWFTTMKESRIGSMWCKV